MGGTFIADSLSPDQSLQLSKKTYDLRVEIKITLTVPQEPPSSCAVDEVPEDRLSSLPEVRNCPSAPASHHYAIDEDICTRTIRLRTTTKHLRPS